MKTINKPKITLVGAGPGDIELITIKGLKAIETADVVLYDALVNEKLLEYASDEAIKIYVGKRSNRHAYSQEEINVLLVKMALLHGHVVRLKGGDPFVFGRGQEEINYANLFDIRTEIIPGISSSIAAPALAGIPVTHRGASESFWVITGTTKDNKLSKDIYTAAKSNATVVILMGLTKLNQITEAFANAGKSTSAIAIIQDASLASQKTVIGTIETIIDLAAEKQLNTPAVIIIGEVVKTKQSIESILINQQLSSN